MSISAAVTVPTTGNVSVQLKSNIQMMMADYNEMCVEREELLFSLADVREARLEL